MIRYKQTLLALLLAIFSGVTVAQNNTNSPYTRYGFGHLAEQGPGNSKAMGGVSYALRDKYQVNFANPASYTAVDSLTFIFDGGISLQNTNYSNGALKMNAKNSSFDYITMEFRASKWAGISLGLLPYANVGYDITQTEKIDDSSEYFSKNYAGEGGLHQLYLGAGFKIFKNLSVGANISYLWGDVTHANNLTFPSSSTIMSEVRSENIALKSYKIDLGLQYTQQLGKKHFLTLGAVYSPGHDIGSDVTKETQVGNSSTGYTVTSKISTVDCGIPATFGVGLAYVYDNRLTVSTDFMTQNWSKTKFMGEENVMCDRTRIGVGAEYIPNHMGRSFFSHVKYRLGGYYSKPYYKIEGMKAAKEYGVTAGFGLPIPRTRSVVSLSAQYVQTKGAVADFLNEKTFRICVGVTFNERWFYKWKVE